MVGRNRKTNRTEYTLSAPTLPQATNNVINVSSLNYILIRVQMNYNVHQGDTIIGYLNNNPSLVYVVSGNYPPFIDLQVPSSISTGHYKAAYQVWQGGDGNANKSLATDVDIFNSSTIYPKPPEYPDAVNGVLYYKILEKKNSILIRANYNNIAENDIVNFYWSGIDAKGNNVGDSIFNSGKLLVNKDNVRDGYIEANIPSKKILSIGNIGIGTGYYTLYRDSDRSLYYSYKSNIVLVYYNLDKLTIGVTSGAPLTNNSSVSVNILSSNQAFLIGRPGLKVVATVSLGAVINESSAVNKNTYDLYLDQNGLGFFSVSYPKTASDIVAPVTINITSPDVGSISSSSAFSQFSPYRSWSGAIRLLSNTDTAPSDGITPCSVYILLNPGLKNITASVTGDAMINGTGKSVKIPAHSDGALSLNITNTTTETVRLDFSIDGQTIQTPSIYLTFIDFPDWSDDE